MHIKHEEEATTPKQKMNSTQLLNKKMKKNEREQNISYF